MKLASLPFKLGVGFNLAIGGTAYYFYSSRQKTLSHPVLRHSLDVLKHDQRILNFCGDNPSPGMYVKKRERLQDNWVSFDFKMKGTLGTLKCSLVGDYHAHAEL